MNFHICSSCHLLFWKAHCVLKVKQGCSKRTNPEDSSRCALLNGGRVGRTSWEAREEGVHYCGVANFPQCLERPRRNSLLTVHRFALIWSFFSFLSFFILFGCMASKMLFLSHVSCLVMCVIMSVDGCLRGSFLLLHRWHYAWCACGFVCVCPHTSTYFLVSVLFSLRSWHSKDKPADNGSAFCFFLFFFISGEGLTLHEC